MSAQEVTVGTQTTVNITMEADVSVLDEVVVIGYGTMKKSDLTGSVVSVSGEDTPCTVNPIECREVERMNTAPEYKS